MRSYAKQVSDIPVETSWTPVRLIEELNELLTNCAGDKFYGPHWLQADIFGIEV